VHAQLLNENQKRSVTITLRLFEERLAEIERLLTISERGILYERIAHFSPAQQQSIRRLIDEARAAIQEMAREFGLERESQDPVRRIVGLLSVTWESLEELYAKPLRAYGYVDPRLPGAIDPWAEKLTQLALAIQAAARAPANGQSNVDTGERE
jgi:hypothetical protein